MSDYDDENDLVVLQWNILAQGLSYLREDGGGFVHEGFCKDALEWPKKKAWLLSHISFMEPHIICLQEVDEPWSLQHTLSLEGYECVWHEKGNSPCLQVRDMPDGCMIAWKRDRFRINPSIYKFPLLQGYGQIGVIVDLNDLKTDKMIKVGTTHLKASKTKENELIRVEQIKEMQRRMKLTDDGSLKILCLDANATPEANERTGEPLCYQEMTKLMTSSFKEANGSEPECTTFKSRVSCNGPVDSKWTLDYILYAGEDWEVSDSISAELTGPIPNKDFLSDHSGILTTFHPSAKVDPEELAFKIKALILGAGGGPRYSISFCKPDCVEMVFVNEIDLNDDEIVESVTSLGANIEVEMSYEEGGLGRQMIDVKIKTELAPILGNGNKSVTQL